MKCKSLLCFFISVRMAKLQLLCAWSHFHRPPVSLSFRGLKRIVNILGHCELKRMTLCSHHWAAGCFPAPREKSNLSQGLTWASLKASRRLSLLSGVQSWMCLLQWLLVISGVMHCLGFGECLPFPREVHKRYRPPKCCLQFQALP